jgi:mannose-6-phosphate isomerase-like protein (cupin superfamily)
MKHQRLDQLSTDQQRTGAGFTTVLEEDSVRAALYELAPGEPDHQSPHEEDEVYVVLRGRARLTSPSQTSDIGAGSVIFVPAHEEHQFTDITEDFSALALFVKPGS